MGQFWKTSSAIALATNMMPLILAAGPALQKSPSQAENQNVPSTAPAACRVYMWEFCPFRSTLFFHSTNAITFQVAIFDICFNAAISHARWTGYVLLFAMVPRFCAGAFFCISGSSLWKNQLSTY